MRSSSLKVYSPVEYTGYKEKRSGHPSEPGSRTGNRKTTRKPKPILYRLRRFCKRLNWKRIGGLAVTTVVIVFTVRGVVGMFSEHAQTKTAPITTSSPAAEESQPYVFYYKDGQAVSWEDVTDAWAAEAGIQKRYALTDAERLEIAQVLTAEAGGEPFAGKIAVAQCILQTCEDEGIRPDEVLRVYAYSKRRPEPTQEALEAVQDVFDFGIMATTKKTIAEAEQAAEIKEATAAPATEPEAPAVTLDELEGMDMNMFDVEETESAPRPVWRITDDGCADWACQKIAEEKAELDRITSLADSQIEKIQQRVEAAQRRYENGTRFLTGKLAEYFETVPHKTTKTKHSYRLLSGTLVKKIGGRTMKQDDDALLAYLKASDNEDMIQTTEKPKWGEFKKRLEIVGGQTVDKTTGELVEGVQIIEKPDTFTVDV